MNVAKTVNDLLKDFLGERFLQSAPLPHVVQQVATSAQLHHDDDVLLGLNRLVDFHHMVVAKFLKQSNLLHLLRLLYLVCECRLVERFESNELAYELVHGEVDFAKGAPA